MSEKPESTNQLRPIYFQPRQLIFHAHGNLANQARILQELMEWADEIAQSKGISLSYPEEGQYVVDFNPMPNPDIYLKKMGTNSTRVAAQKAIGVSQGKKTPIGSEKTYVSPTIKVPPAFSLVRVNAGKGSWQKTNTDSRKEESDADAKEQIKAMDELLDLIVLLDSKRDTAPIRLEAVSPNWLMSGSSRPGGTGGPGGLPDRYAGPPTTTDYKFNTEKLPPRIYDLVENGNQGAGVAVAILDTSYPESQLETFYDTWAAQGHQLVRKLFGRDDLPPGALREATTGRLRVQMNSDVDTNLPDLGIDGHDYNMTDHGLFVAGIINSLAPQAELHLYQVLNKNGLGDLFIIAQTLQNVLAGDFGDRKLVVNLSLTMNLPLEEGFLRSNDQFKVGNTLLRQRPWWLARWVARLFNTVFNKPHLCVCDTWYERQAVSFAWISDMVYARNSRVIAAAGNESKGRSARLPALYPAAFDSVLGVGALARGSITSPGRPATYSNLADSPVSNGISTLGGEEGEAQGILGIYMGEFPNGDNGSHQENQSGWAWWSGTSFATPIVTGVTAAVLSCLPPDSAAEDAIAELFAELQPSTSTAVDPSNNEDILFVTQG